MATKHRASITLILLVSGLSAPYTAVAAQHEAAPSQLAENHSERSKVSPSRQINRGRKPNRRSSPDSAIRSIDGSGNSLVDPSTGAGHENLRRLVPSDYADGISTPAGEDRPSARAISNAMATQTESILNAANASDYLWQWGQFVDHDLDLTDGIDPEESFPIEIPQGDISFDPTGTGLAEMELNRSLYDLETGFSAENPR